MRCSRLPNPASKLKLVTVAGVVYEPGAEVLVSDLAAAARS